MGPLASYNILFRMMLSVSMIVRLSALNFYLFIIYLRVALLLLSLLGVILTVALLLLVANTVVAPMTL